jgi:hypothetical protein
MLYPLAIKASWQSAWSRAMADREIKFRLCFRHTAQYLSGWLGFGDYSSGNMLKKCADLRLPDWHAAC